MERIEATDAVRDEYRYQCRECKRTIEDEEPMWLDEHGYVHCEEHAEGNEWSAS